jgi:nucleotide-binding universal stress UspA family protein
VIEMMKILVATDGSDGAKAAVTDGVRLAARLGAKILTVAAEPLPPAYFGVPPYYFSDPESKAFAAKTAEAAAETARQAGVEAESHVLGPTVDPARAIVEFARKQDADLIVVGSRGLGAFAGAVLGSVSRSIVRHADRPVLVAKQYGAAGENAHEHFFVGTAA